MRVVMRGLGWLLIAGGVLVALYLVYALYWTNFQTDGAQAELLDDWELEVGQIGDVDPDADAASAGDAPSLPAVDLGEAVAALQFVRPGTEEVPVYDEPLFIVEGVNVETLQKGPGHYPGTAMPGEDGNFAIAGHRTTYGAPFYDLDQAQPGDEIHVTDRSGTRWVYEVVEQVVVHPSDNHVLGPDPLETGRPMLTLTTCNPRWSNAERLIVHAQLAEEHLPQESV